jgi:hypothetical protein
MKTQLTEDTYKSYIVLNAKPQLMEFYINKAGFKGCPNFLKLWEFEGCHLLSFTVLDQDQNIVPQSGKTTIMIWRGLILT